MKRIQVYKSLGQGMTGSPVSVLLGSGGISTQDRRDTFRNLVSSHFSGCKQVLFVPYASQDHDKYTIRMQEFLGPDAPIMSGIHTFEDTSQALTEADGIYVGGGNSFLLIRDLHELGLVTPIRDMVLRGAPYLGVSAGANVACPTMMTTNDMPITLPTSFSSLGLVPFQINPHYHPGKILFMDGNELRDHYGESRAQRIAEFHRIHQDPVLGMWEGSFAHWDGSIGQLSGRATAFRVGDNPVELADGSTFEARLELV